VSIPQVKFSPYIMNKIKFFISKNWKTRDGKKSLQQLARELDHTCTREYLEVLFKGDDAHPSFDKEIANKLESLEELDPKDKLAFQGGIDTKISEVSKLYTEGYTAVFKNNLLFENGIPVSVREGDDRKRFGRCHKALSEADVTRKRVPVGPDVTSSAFKKAGTRGQKKRKRKGTRRNRRK
jgi:hypothetical protein